MLPCAIAFSKKQQFYFLLTPYVPLATLLACLLKYRDTRTLCNDQTFYIRRKQLEYVLNLANFIEIQQGLKYTKDVSSSYYIKRKRVLSNVSIQTIYRIFNDTRIQSTIRESMYTKWKWLVTCTFHENSCASPSGFASPPIRYLKRWFLSQIHEGLTRRWQCDSTIEAKHIIFRHISG